MKELAIRSAAGLIFVAAVISSIIIGQVAFFGLFSIIVIIASLEYSSITRVKPNSLKAFYAFLSFLVFLISFLTSFGIADIKLLLLILPILFLPAIMELYIKESSTDSIAKAIFGILYTSIPFSLMNFFFSEPNHKYILLSVFVLVWVFDSFAYLSGVSIGKHKLFKSISPKKSWEGFFGGMIFSVAASYVISRYISDISFMYYAIMAVLISITATFGDLLESKLKRSAGVKDSGKIIPGHGGILDRFDAVMFILPIISVFLLFIL